MKVVLDRRVLANFRRRAWRRFPKEYMEALMGRREGDTFYLTVFHPFPHDATVWCCSYDPDDIGWLEEAAEAVGLKYLGSIHTHTGLKTCAHPSKPDHISGVEDGSHIEAIMHLHRAGKATSRLNFYIPTSPITIELA